MSYPPGPGRPGSPYGRRPYGQSPPGQPPQAPRPYAPQPYGRAPYPQPGGFGGPPPWPPPPPRKRTGLWAGLCTLSVTLVAFFVTGLVAPGFLLDEPDAQPVTLRPDDFARPRQVAAALVDGVNARDKVGLYELTYSSAPAALYRNIEHIGVLSDARLTLVRRISPTKAVARLSIILKGTRLQVRSDLRKKDGRWCWQDWNAAGTLANI